MELSAIGLSAFIKLLLDALKNADLITPKYITVMAFAFGAILYPLSIMTFTFPVFIMGAMVGSGAVGFHETLKTIKESKKKSDDIVVSPQP